MEEIFNWVMLGWLLNVIAFIICIIVVVVKVFRQDEVEVVKINTDIYKSKVKPLPKAQKWLSWLIPFYGALKNIIFLGYLIMNWGRDTMLVLIESDEIMEHYRIFKRGGLRAR